MEKGESELSPEEEKELAKCKWEDNWGGPMHREGTSVQEGAPEVRGWEVVRGRAGDETRSGS